MKKKFFYLLVIIIALIAQTSAVPVLTGGRSGLDIILMLVLAWSILDGFGNFLPWAITIGILYDLVSTTAIGVHVLIFLAVIYMVSFLSKRFSVEFGAFGMVMIFFFVVVSVFISQTTMVFANSGGLVSLKELESAFISAGWFLLQIIYNLLAFVGCFFSVKWMKKYFMIEI